MSDVLPLLVLAGALAAVLGFFRWLASRVRRRGTAGAAVTAALASYDEAFRVTAHDAHHEIRAQAERKAPLLSPAARGRPAAAAHRCQVHTRAVAGRGCGAGPDACGADAGPEARPGAPAP